MVEGSRSREVLGRVRALAGLCREARRSDLIYKNKPFKTFKWFAAETVIPMQALYER